MVFLFVVGLHSSSGGFVCGFVYLLIEIPSLGAGNLFLHRHSTRIVIDVLKGDRFVGVLSQANILSQESLREQSFVSIFQLTIEILSRSD